MARLRALGATAAGLLLLVSTPSACDASDPAPPASPRPVPTPLVPTPLVSPPASTPTTARPTTPALPGVDCATSVRTGPLPAWARAGFSDDGSSFRHVEGLHGRVVGVLFGYPLSAPARPDGANKILWVERDHAAGRLTIRARLRGAGPVVVREVGFGGGQSVVDLPRAGCWRLTLTWGGDVTDVVDVPYVAHRPGG